MAGKSIQQSISSFYFAITSYNNLLKGNKENTSRFMERVKGDTNK